MKKKHINATPSRHSYKYVSDSFICSGLVLLVFACVMMGGCSNSEEKKKVKKELLIYCGITMIQPMSELASMIEEQEQCKIRITKGGSGNLLKSIIHNKTGDLYLPGSNSYYKMIEEKYDDLITDKVLVGYNKAVILVQKGNPMGIASDLSNLANKEYGVMIGNPDSGSIGKETKKILEQRGIYMDVIRNVMGLTSDSKDLVKAIKNKDADIVINWHATSIWDDNQKYIDAIEIDSKYAKKKKLFLGLLKFSKHQSIAKKFMCLANSAEGKKIFNKYGLYCE